MKQFYLMMCIMAIAMLTACGGKNEDPTPIIPPPVTPPVNGGNNGGTGGTGNTDKGYVFKNRFSPSRLIVLDNNNAEVTLVSFRLADTKDANYDYRNGTVKITTKNFNVVNTTYKFQDAYSYSMIMNNMLPRDYKASDVDSTKACFKIINPANKDNDGKQIIELIYLWDSGIIGSNSIAVGGGAKLNGIPIPITTISDKVAKSVYKLL